MSNRSPLPPGLDSAAVQGAAMDLDHTILGASLELRPAICEAVASVRASGVEPIVATGRMFASARPYARQLGIRAPMICYQGALVADPVSGDWLQHRPLGVALAREVIAHARREGFHVNVYLDDRLYVEELNDEARTYAAHARLEAHPVGDLERWLQRPTTKIVVVGDPVALDRLQDSMRAEFDGRLFIAKSLPFFLEVAEPGVSKGEGLRFVCEQLGIDPAHVVAFGDGANDLELLESAGLGVAIEDGDRALLAGADWTVPGPEEDGVARFLAGLAAARAG